MVLDFLKLLKLIPGVHHNIFLTLFNIINMYHCNILYTYTHIYCNVESNARRFPSFPLDHLLTSGSRNSSNLCIKNKHLMFKKMFLRNKGIIFYHDDQESYMSLCLLPLSQNIPHVLFSKCF